MAQIEEVTIDVRDVDHEWFRDVRVFLDRVRDRYYLPRESAERLGEIDPDTGDAWLIDGRVAARAEEVDLDRELMRCWSVGCDQLIVRPASNRGNRSRLGE